MSRYKKVEITPKKLEDIKKDVAGQTLILVIGYMMDEMDYDADHLIDIWNGVSRYAEAVDSKLISLNKVCDIINQNTWLGIRWNR